MGSLRRVSAVLLVFGCDCLLGFDELARVVDRSHDVLVAILLLVRCHLAVLLNARQLLGAQSGGLTLQVLDHL